VVGYLGLGSNVGDRRALLQAAVDALAARGVVATRLSSTYATAPVGEIVDQPAFLNACAEVVADDDPEALLRTAKAVERELGRQSTPGDADYVRHGPRRIDVDILLFGDREHRSPGLAVPHPALLERRFVLIPLLELDMALTTPDGSRLSDALAVLPVDEAVQRDGPPLTLPG
jgi:2-amino-4-hydroxy-6-hydroxymethyldihydropteridine diphosphokinase